MTFFWRVEAAGRESPGSESLSFGYRQKKVTKEKATRSLGRFAVPCGAQAVRGQTQTRLRLKQVSALIRPSFRSSAQPGRGDRDRIRGAGCARRVLRSCPFSLWEKAGMRLSPHPHLFPKPFCPQTVGSPFFSLDFFGEAKKSNSPAGARPGLIMTGKTCKS